jgi:hypothetical protein
LEKRQPFAAQAVAEGTGQIDPQIPIGSSDDQIDVERAARVAMRD